MQRIRWSEKITSLDLVLTVALRVIGCDALEEEEQPILVVRFIFIYFVTALILSLILRANHAMLVILNQI